MQQQQFAKKNYNCDTLCGSDKTYIFLLSLLGHVVRVGK